MSIPKTKKSQEIVDNVGAALNDSNSSVAETHIVVNCIANILDLGSVPVGWSGDHVPDAYAKPADHMRWNLWRHGDGATGALMRRGVTAEGVAAVCEAYGTSLDAVDACIPARSAE